MRAIDLINQRIITAASLNLLPGQDNHGDSVETINYAALDKKLGGVFFHPLPQVLHKEQLPVSLTVAEAHEPAYVVKSSGSGVAWFLAVLFSLIAIGIGWFFVTSSSFFGRFAISRDGKPGGGAARAIFRGSQIMRRRLRERAVEIFHGLPIHGKQEITERNFKKFLSDFDFDYTLWHGHTTTMTDAERALIADQNAFVEAIRLIDNGEHDLASVACERALQIFDKHMPLAAKPAYMEKVTEKAAAMSAIFISENPVLEPFSAADCAAMGLPDVETCSVRDILTCDLSHVDGREFNPTQTHAYVGLLRNLRLMFSTIGTRDFLVVAAVYKGKNYPCVEEAMRMDLTQRHAMAVASGEASFDWLNALIAASLVTSVAISAVSATKSLLTWAGGGGGSAFINSVRERLARRAETNDDFSSRDPVQVELENIHEPVTAQTLTTTEAFDLIRSIDPSGEAFADFVLELRLKALSSVTDEATLSVRSLQAAIVDVSTPTAEYVVLGADSTSPHFINKRSISSAVGVHYGSFSEESMSELSKLDQLKQLIDSGDRLETSPPVKATRSSLATLGALANTMSRVRSRSHSRSSRLSETHRELDYAS